MKRFLPWVLALLVFGAGLGLIVYQRMGRHTPAPPTGPVAQQAPSTQQPASPQPASRQYPLARAGQAAAGGEHSGAGSRRSQPLPALRHSDGAMQNALDGLLGKQRVAHLLVPRSIIRRVVVSIDNLPRRQVPPRDKPVQPLKGPFEVTRRHGNLYLSPSNYARYDPYVRLLDSVNANALVNVYVHFYPLFQQAYQNLGYPDGYFNDRLIYVIDNLLATPKVSYPVQLVQPNVMYQYADPDLERLSAGQKILIRMGPRNAARVKRQLRAIRKALLAHVVHHQPQPTGQSQSG